MGHCRTPIGERGEPDPGLAELETDILDCDIDVRRSSRYTPRVLGFGTFP